MCSSRADPQFRPRSPISCDHCSCSVVKSRLNTKAIHQTALELLPESNENEFIIGVGKAVDEEAGAENKSYSDISNYWPFVLAPLITPIALLEMVG